MRYVLTALALILAVALCSYVNPVVSNVTANQRTDGSDLVDIYYDLLDGDVNLCQISLLLSIDGGASYSNLPSAANLSGNIGTGQSSGTGKHIVWDAGSESYLLDSNTYRFKVVADDGTLPPNFVLVEGGTFNNGVSNVTLSGFWIDKYEVTQSGWFAVMGSLPPFSHGTGDNYPVHRVSWFNAILYCNLRSMQENLNPCYSYAGYGTDPNAWPAGWQNDQNNHLNFSCNWSANGYRLPTEMEWVFAARAGNLAQGTLYSGSDDINTVCWYSGNSGNLTHPVGLKTANGLGIFDMSGNSAEWCWDIYGDLPLGDQINPTGPTTGSSRVHHGGSFWDMATVCRITTRYPQSPSFENDSYGLRVVRRDY
jgi:formylglycine-generating enzyme required for sulfatase activity